ncbi:uncharacterized MFS-type transporter C09D4.1-like [Clytia hemisphaerica]|uniref:uncharacterized MFS-type transporter C09D4.1-like n=1 Tax=Clytia hemisphaerica TaxID=252671 RepID=UPI0034D3F3F1
MNNNENRQPLIQDKDVKSNPPYYESQRLIQNEKLTHGTFEHQIKDEKKETNQPPALMVYKSRWLMLLIFCLITMLNGSMFMGLSSVVDTVAPYYGVSQVDIEWLSNMFMVVYVLVAMPSAYCMSKYGVRTILTVAAGCGAAAASLQYGGYRRKSYVFVVVGQFFAAVAYSNILQVPGKLSAVWFAPKERGLSTSIGVFMNILGVASGFVQPTQMIPSTNDFTKVESGLRMFFLSKMILAVFVFALTAFAFREQPPTPPSHSQIDGVEEPGFKDSLKMLFIDKDFLLMAQAYGIYYGLYVGVSVAVSPLVLWKFEHVQKDVNELIGWMGFSCNLAAIISCYLIGSFLDRTSRYKAVALFLNAGSALMWTVFALLLTKTNSFEGVFTAYVVFGIFGIPYFASGVEQAAEMTSPVPEGTSSTVILLLGNIYGFALIYGFGYLTQQGYYLVTVYLILGLYVLSTFFLVVAKTELKRSKAENSLWKDEKEQQKSYVNSANPDENSFTPQHDGHHQQA